MSNYQRACTCNMYVPYQGSKRFQSAEHDANYGWMLMYGVGSRWCSKQRKRCCFVNPNKVVDLKMKNNKNFNMFCFFQPNLNNRALLSHWIGFRKWQLTQPWFHADFPSDVTTWGRSMSQHHLSRTNDSYCPMLSMNISIIHVYWRFISSIIPLIIIDYPTMSISGMKFSHSSNDWSKNLPCKIGFYREKYDQW